ncbi:MAG: nucleotidyltransferase family protein [Deltaproteobacteria bacterium]|uniref:Nucleotidyltransferase family protein n=1 Tax=Candidatus Zymogenus saltonus TaxID=2844893 RepID=A0A9D8PRQ3_9DELT|nr:nucleotidyltransferase family protein [Candidatus Zymogenus saltonus]
MTIRKTLKGKRKKIIEIAERHGAHNVRVFGSASRGKTNEKSDVNFLVDFDEKTGLFDHIAFIHELEDLIGMKVDVVTENSIYWLIRRRILKEANPL